VMVRGYVELVREVQPQGPYHLLGWSSGGLIAHAMATQLQDDGDQVSFLSLLDASPPDLLGDEDLNEQQIVARILRGMNYRIEDLSDVPQVSRVIEMLRSENEILRSFDESSLAAIVGVYGNNLRITREYQPRRFRGDVLCFRASRTHPEVSHIADAWKPYVDGSVDEHSIECGHADMTSPQPLAMISAILEDRLSKEPEA
jgi:nonribosomal peptide synthetase DhbF